MKKHRIILESKIITKKPRLFLVGADQFLGNGLGERFKKKGCQVYQFNDLNDGQLFACEFVIVFFRQDLVKAACKLGKKCCARVLFIVDKNQQLLANSAYQLAKFYKKGVDIRFGNLAKETSIDDKAKHIEELMFGKTGILSSSFLDQFSSPRPPLPIPLPPKPLKEKKFISRGKKNHWRRNFFLAAALATIVFLLPIGFFLLSLGQALEQLSQMQVKLSQGTLTSAQVAETHDQFQRLEQLTKPVNVETLNSAVSIGLQLTGVGRHSVNVIKLGKDLSGSIFAGQTIPLADTLDNMEQELELLKSETARTSSSLSQLSDSRFMNLPLLRPLGKRLTNGGVRLNDGLSYLNLAQTMLPIISYIAGADGKRVYLILLQNNMELRPAGGFIGSYGLVTFAGGKLKNLIIEDIYSADGQLRGHIDPPLPLQKYLGLEHWYLRDSNFQPDFFESAKMAEWFLRKEIGIDVDGVIALDLTFAKRMLEALGGIDLPDYNERITASNFFLKAQVAAEADFFPGSTNKRDFLGSFARAFIRELTSGSSLPWMRLAYAVKTSLDEKHLQLSFHDPRVQGVFDQAGWSGRLLPVVCPEDNSRLKCLADYVSVVDANVGVNKANYYLKRDFEHEVKIDKDYLSHQITVYYSNESPGETFPSGTYRTFTRVYLAKEADNIEIFFQGQKREAKDLTSDISHDKVIIGTYLEVLPQQRYQLQVRYNLPLPSSPFLYQLLLQKQAGTEHDSLHLKLSSDKKIRSSNIAIDKLTAVDYNSDLAIDRLFRFEIE